MSRMMATDTSALAALLGLVKSGKVIDLSVPLAEDLPSTWPTHMPFQRKLFNYFKDQPALGQPVSGSRGPYHTAVLTIDEHAGTHVDAPAHFIPPPGSGLPNAAEIGKVTVEQLALTDLIGPAAVIDVTALTDTGKLGSARRSPRNTSPTGRPNTAGSRQARSSCSVQTGT